MSTSKSTQAEAPRTYRDIVRANEERVAERYLERLEGIDLEVDADRAAYYDLDR